MTTIAYHKESNTISCDSQVTGCGLKGLSENKIIELLDYVYAGSGMPSDVEHLIECYIDDLPVEKSLDADAILISKETKKAKLISLNSKSWLISATEINCNYALGTGRELALGAMGAGASAFQAVNVAIDHDIYSGGKVYAFDIDEWEFF